MDSKEFSQIRHYLGKTQNQLARILCVSPKAIQSFEQGWRNIPASAERQLLFLLSLEKSLDANARHCWEIRDCPDQWRENCIAWELGGGHFCWFINGTFCNGETQENWSKKLRLCRQCEVFQAMFPVIRGQKSRKPSPDECLNQV
ncbi:helix-turn-helix domain-containing protein [Chloroflexota bacterium]